MSNPFLTVFTRCCRRPRALSRNILSVMNQTDQDIEQVFVLDNKHRGLRWANSSFYENRHRVNGKYVYMLDDDNRLRDLGFVEKLRRVVKRRQNPGVVLVKVYQEWSSPKILPQPEIWDLSWERGERPDKWIGNGMCVVVRADLWKEYVVRYADAHHTGGDWHFINALIESGASFVRLRGGAVGMKDQRGKGERVETEDDGWFDPIRGRFGVGKDLVLRWHKALDERKLLFLAENDWANVGYRCATAVSEHTSWRARCVAINSHRFEYPTDILSPSGSNLKKIIAWADVIHGFDNWLPFDSLAGDKLRAVTYNGTHYRNNYAKCNKHDSERGLVSLCTTVDLTRHGATWMPIPMKDHGLRKPKRDTGWRIAHAPSKFRTKGTHHVRAAQNTLPNVSIDIINGVTVDECLKRKSMAHIYLDQFTGLGYGVNALESWLMGQPVVSYANGKVRALMMREIGFLPFLLARPEKIAYAIKRLMNERALYRRFSRIGRGYVVGFHDPKLIANRLVQLYD